MKKCTNQLRMSTILKHLALAIVIGFHLRMSLCFKANGRIPARLPKVCIIGYANWNQCDEKIVQAVKDGLNVVIWFSVNLIRDPQTGRPMVQGGPDMDCVADRIHEIRSLPNGKNVVHLLSIGGWNSPHPDTTNPPEVVFDELHRWNLQEAARPEKQFFGFDGFDWDIEGNDTPSSPFNHFSAECLDSMGVIAQCAKRQGYLFAMAPAESYLDPHTSLFDRSLKHSYPEWTELQPDFKYHGRNAYAYILAKYGKVLLDAEGEQGEVLENVSDTFDFVVIQLYEGYSHAEYNLTVMGNNPAVYVRDLVTKFRDGWMVPFSTDPALNFPDQIVTLDPERLVIGIANGWAGDGKFLFISPDSLKSIYAELKRAELKIRGFAFWNILDEGKPLASDPEATPIWLAKSLKHIVTVQEDVHR